VPKRSTICGKKGKFADRPGNSPIVVLLDLKMPKMDGLQVLKEMKGDSLLKHIPVVVLTSSREESDLVETYDLGCKWICRQTRRV